MPDANVLKSNFAHLVSVVLSIFLHDKVGGAQEKSRTTI